MKPKIDTNARDDEPRVEQVRVTYPVLDETQLCLRWNLSPKTLQRWRSERIGPPAWHLWRSVRYLLMEIEAFERKAQVTCRSSTGRALSQSSPTAREDAIEQMVQQRPARRDQVFYLSWSSFFGHRIRFFFTDQPFQNLSMRDSPA